MQSICPQCESTAYFVGLSNDKTAIIGTCGKCGFNYNSKVQ